MQSDFLHTFVFSIFFPQPIAQRRIFLRQCRFTQLSRDNVVIHHSRNVIRRSVRDFLLTHCFNRGRSRHFIVRNGDTTARTGRLLAKTDAATAAATTTAESLRVAADRRDFLLFFHQDFIETADGFFQFFAKALSALLGAFAGVAWILADATSAAGASYGSLCATGPAAAAAASSFSRSFSFSFGSRSAAAKAFAGLAHTTHTAR